jgi:DNA-binding IclR family transcriptional regulator
MQLRAVRAWTAAGIGWTAGLPTGAARLALHHLTYAGLVERDRRGA